MATPQLAMIERHLDGQARLLAFLSTIGSGAAFLLAITILGAQWWLTTLLAEGIWHYSPSAARILGYLAIGAIFGIYFWRGDQSPSYLRFSESQKGAVRVKLVDPSFEGWVSWIAAVPVLGGALPAFASILCVGPAILAFSGRLANRADRLRIWPTAEAARIVNLLYRYGDRVPFETLVPKLDLGPQAWPPLLAKLEDMRGIVFLTSEPQGLTLAETYTAEVGALIKAEEAKLLKNQGPATDGDSPGLVQNSEGLH